MLYMRETSFRTNIIHVSRVRSISHIRIRASLVDFLEILHEAVHRIQSLLQMNDRQLLSSRKCKGLGRPRRVFDLPSVDVLPRSKTGDVLLVDEVERLDLAQECCPDLLLRLGRKIGEVEGDVDSREEGLVEDFNAVGGEEEDAFVVFNVAQAEVML